MSRVLPYASGVGGLSRRLLNIEGRVVGGTHEAWDDEAGML